jgi:hypothetical protein
MDNVKIFFSVIGLLVLGVVATVLLRSDSTTSAAPGKYDAFATCLREKGATFYGAFWCEHCRAQKKLFGSSAKLLPYVECSPASGQGQTQVCIDKNVASYPTWEFADGSRLTGEIALEALAEKTSCLLPGGEASTPIDSGASSPAL